MKAHSRAVKGWNCTISIGGLGISPRPSWLTHGHGEHSGRYGNVVNWFVPHGYAVYAFDLRGHGRSPGPRGHIDRWDVLREDLKAFLMLVQGQALGQPVFLIGHSMGGLIALEYVLHYPEGLAGVVVSGPVLSEPGISPFLIALARYWHASRPG